MAVKTFNSFKWETRFCSKRLVTEYYLLLMDCSAISEVTIQCVLSMTDAWSDNQLKDFKVVSNLSVQDQMLFCTTGQDFHHWIRISVSWRSLLCHVSKKQKQIHLFFPIAPQITAKPCPHLCPAQQLLL